MDSSTTWMVQEHPCRSRQRSPFATLPQCLACYDVAASRGRRAASTKVQCRFKGFRTVRLAPDKAVTAVGFGAATANRVQEDKAAIQPREQSLGSSRCNTSKKPSAGDGDLLDRAQDTRTELHFPHVYDRPLGPDVVALIKRTTAEFLLPILRQEISHMDQEGAVFLLNETKYRSLCDVCASELFCGAWFCPSCALDVCHPCAEQLTTSNDLHRNLARFVHCATGDHAHSVRTMRPIARLDRGVTQSYIERMALAAKETALPFLRYFSLRDDLVVKRLTVLFSNQPLPPPLSQRIPDDAITEHVFAPQTLPVYQARSLSRNQFLHLWTAGIPVVLTEAQKHFQGHWDPRSFIDQYGKLWVTPIDCRTDKQMPRMAASEFFTLLLDGSDQEAVLKLKDWPPKADFQTTFGKLNHGFFSSVPIECADLVCKGGIYNLAAHFPEGAIAPDLGPKLYIAMGADGDTDGTTRLHLDVTCAINLMMWSEDMTSKRPGAEWQIFPADSVETLRSFLREEFSLRPDEDPIHQQRYYISHAMLTRLRERHGVSPWTIYQSYGDVVLIPAGCPHQVRNLAHAIKAACDFVSPQNLTRTVNIVSSLRAHRIASGSGEDVLQLQTLVWFGWVAMCAYEDDRAQRTPQPPTQEATFAQPSNTSTQPEVSLKTDINCPDARSGAASRKRPQNLTSNQIKCAKKKARLLPNPAFQVTCPFPDTCSLGTRPRSVPGTLDHLRDAHPVSYRKINDKSMKELRGLDGPQFVKRLQDLLGPGE